MAGGLDDLGWTGKKQVMLNYIKDDLTLYAPVKVTGQTDPTTDMAYDQIKKKHDVSALQAAIGFNAKNALEQDFMDKYKADHGHPATKGQHVNYTTQELDSAQKDAYKTYLANEKAQAQQVIADQQSQIKQQQDASAARAVDDKNTLTNLKKFGYDVDPSKGWSDAKNSQEAIKFMDNYNKTHHANDQIYFGSRSPSDVATALKNSDRDHVTKKSMDIAAKKGSVVDQDWAASRKNEQDPHKGQHKEYKFNETTGTQDVAWVKDAPKAPVVDKHDNNKELAKNTKQPKHDKPIATDQVEVDKPKVQAAPKAETVDLDALKKLETVGFHENADWAKAKGVAETDKRYTQKGAHVTNDINAFKVKYNEEHNLTSKDAGYLAVNGKLDKSTTNALDESYAATINPKLDLTKIVIKDDQILPPVEDKPIVINKPEIPVVIKPIEIGNNWDKAAAAVGNIQDQLNKGGQIAFSDIEKSVATVNSDMSKKDHRLLHRIENDLKDGKLDNLARLDDLKKDFQSHGVAPTNKNAGDNATLAMNDNGKGGGGIQH